MLLNLEGKNILVGVSASISIYKSLELLRLFVKSGADVRVVMSEEAKKFVTPLTFEAISSNEVLHSDSENWHSLVNHIGYGSLSDIFVIAPISANSIGKLSMGIADNLLLQVALAFKKTIVIAPSANTNMATNPSIIEGLNILKKRGYEIVDTTCKTLVCKSFGEGALADVEDIYYSTCKELLKEDFWCDKDVVVTGGGSFEKIDDVRFIGNFSSGKMASSLALGLYLNGANVVFISSKFPYKLPKEIKQISSISSYDMKQALEKELNTLQKPYLFMSSAISDYVPLNKNSGKLKKSSIGEGWSLELKKNEDILKSVKAYKKIGFKAEFDENGAKDSAIRALMDKKLDAICLNILGGEISFGSDDTQIHFITKDDAQLLKKSSKMDVALKIVDMSKKL